MYTFTQRWFDCQRPVHLNFINETHKNILEIGAFEGLSTTFFLDLPFTESVISIDPFFTDDPITPVDENTFDIFKENVKQSINATKHTHIKKPSADVLSQYVFDGETFDYILVDGSHCSNHVFIDALLSFELVRPGGIVFFDDYGASTVGPAIDLALEKSKCKLTVIHKGYHLVVLRE